MSKRIPDRWLPYVAVGKQIEGTPFIAFKVPLDKTFFENKDVEEHLRFTPEDLMQKIPNLGLIIDLTATHRYYHPSTFTNLGIKHKKLIIEGQRVPSNRNINEFCSTVKEFVKNPPSNSKHELIGVHCTHGVNRTGFLICAYMIQHYGFHPTDATQKFADARGFGIERENYTHALTAMYKEKSFTRNRFSKNMQIIRNPNERHHHQNQDKNKNDLGYNQKNTWSNRPYRENWRADNRLNEYYSFPKSNDNAYNNRNWDSFKNYNPNNSYTRNRYIRPNQNESQNQH